MSQMLPTGLSVELERIVGDLGPQGSDWLLRAEEAVVTLDLEFDDQPMPGPLPKFHGIREALLFAWADAVRLIGAALVEGVPSVEAEISMWPSLDEFLDGAFAELNLFIGPAALTATLSLFDPV